MSSKRAQRRRSCTGKKRYTRKQAASAAYNLRNMNGKYHHYRCKFCKGWHVGRRTRRQMQGFRAAMRYKKG